MRNLAQEARRRRLSGNHHRQNSLVGYCFDNSYVLYNICKENGYDPNIVCGASKRYSEEVLREYSVDELNTVSDLGGLTHFWIEVDGKIVDIASDVPGQVGEILIQTKLPNEYYRLDDSYEYAEQTLSSAKINRCSYCGGKTGSCGCPYEK